MIGGDKVYYFDGKLFLEIVDLNNDGQKRITLRWIIHKQIG
jgi:hypothetical protein